MSGNGGFHETMLGPMDSTDTSVRSAGADEALHQQSRPADRRRVRLPLAPVELGLIAITLVAFVIALGSGQVTRDYNSDDVAIQVIMQSWLAGQPLDSVAGIDNFVLKAPLYALFSVIPNSRGQMFAMVLVCNTIMLAGFVVALRRLLRFDRDTTPMRLLLGYLPLVAYFGLTLAPIDRHDPLAKNEMFHGATYFNLNCRQAEIGLMLLAFVAFDRFLCERRTHWSPRLLVCLVVGALATGAFFYSDPFFVYTMGGGLGATAVVLWLRSRLDLRGLAATIGFLGLSITSMGFFGRLMDAAGFHTHSMVQESFVPLDSLAVNLTNTLHAPFNIYRADLFGRQLATLGTLAFVVNALLVVLSLAALVHGLVLLQRTDSALTMLITLTVVINIAALAASTNGQFSINARYLFTGCAILVLLMAHQLLAWFGAVPTRRRAALVAVGLAVVVATNVLLSARAIHKGDPPQKLQPSTRLIEVLRGEGLSKGYADYWVANPVTYFSDRQILTLPLKCGQGQQPVRSAWLVNLPDFEVPAERSFYIHYTSESGECLPQRAFGNPVKEIRVDAQTTIYVYDRDVGRPLPFR